MRGFWRLRSSAPWLALFLLLVQAWFGPAAAVRAAAADGPELVVCHGDASAPAPGHPAPTGEHCPACPLCQALAGDLVLAAPPVLPGPKRLASGVRCNRAAALADVTRRPRPYHPTGPPALS